MQMTIETFIDNHRGELDAAIRAMVDNPNYPISDDDEREQFLINDEGWYDRAISEGVDMDD